LRESLVTTLEDKAVGLDPQDARAIRGKVEAIKRQESHWTAFKILEESLGATTYRETVKKAFSGAATVEVPNTYKALWRLGIRGLLTLNLDRLVTRAHSEYRPGTVLAEFNGKEVSRLRGLLNGHQPFVGNLHGVSEDTKSWVLTQQSLSALLQDAAYQSFIETCLSTHTVLFIGISADDRAVGGHLQRLASLGIETSAHYWLTDRRDATTDAWAENAGIRVIGYGSHGKEIEISEFFADLSSFVPEDSADVFLPVVPDEDLATEPIHLPEPDELLGWDAERIRRALNERAMQLLHGDDGPDFDAYDQFCKKYDEAIYRAWYTSAQGSDNTLLGYRLNEEIARGSFGRVYAATSPDGEAVAVKVLLEEVRRNPDLFKSFRRGVRSMRILHDREVDGMVAYLAASEIPAFVVMEWVDGPNLAQATQAGYLTDWPTLLKGCVQLAQIIRRAHELPERVLHRDLRPSNVMLSGYYADSQDWTVVVLDFDLSWHRGAFEQSVLHTSAAGYLAPEQMRPIGGVSTRNSAVDSFGLGMTLLYLCTGTDPSPDQHRHGDWENVVRNACRRLEGAVWRSVPERFARLIIAATRDEQASRWDMAEIAGELERLEDAILNPSDVGSAELLAEEVAANSEVMSGYEWDADKIRATRILRTGMQVEIRADIEGQRVQLLIDWTSTGTEERRNLGKYIKTASQAAVDQLAAAGWEKMEDKVESRSIRILASLDAGLIRGRTDDVASSIDQATRKLRFSD